MKSPPPDLSAEINEDYAIVLLTENLKALEAMIAEVEADPDGFERWYQRTTSRIKSLRRAIDRLKSGG